jgi:hypothetical protein
MPGDDWLSMSVGGVGERKRDGAAPFCLTLHGHIHLQIRRAGMTTDTHDVIEILDEHARHFKPVLIGEAPCPIAGACTKGEKACQQGKTHLWEADRQLTLFGRSVPVKRKDRRKK